MSQRIQLTDHALERRYLGDLLHASKREQDTHLAAAERVTAVDLGSLAYGRLLAAIHELHHERTAIEPLCVRKWLEQRQAQASIEALDELLANYEPQLDSLAVMSARLVELARARRMREHHMRGAEAAERLDLETAQEHARELLNASDRRHVDLVTLHSSAMVAVNNARRDQAERNSLRRIPFGYSMIDTALHGGMRPATMAIVGGRTGAGKSSLMLGAALRQASYGIRVGIVSCEDPPDIWGERAIGHFATEPVERLLGGQLALNGTDALGRALANLERIGVVLSYALNRPLLDVLSAVRALIADGCQVVYVDYIQAIRLGHSAKRHELVGDAAQQLKAECQAHGVALVLGSQLNRAEKRERFTEPYDGDLKESGDLENATEALILLWKTSDADDAKALGKVAKVKWSTQRPRFELTRDAVTGALTGLVPHEGRSSNGQHAPEKWE